MSSMSESKRTTTVDLPESPVILTHRQDRAQAEHLLRRVAPEAIEGDGVARLDVSAFTSSL